MSNKTSDFLIFTASLFAIQFFSVLHIKSVNFIFDIKIKRVCFAPANDYQSGVQVISNSVKKNSLKNRNESEIVRGGKMSQEIGGFENLRKKIMRPNSKVRCAIGSSGASSQKAKKFTVRVW